MNKFFKVLTFFLITASLFAQTSIAVLELEGKGLTEMEASILTDRLRNELFQTGKYRVVERELMGEIMNEQGFQLSECTSTECMIEIGQLLGVDQMVGGSVSKFGSMFSVAVRLVSVETGEYLGTATYDHEGRMEDLLKVGMRIVSNQLSGFKRSDAVSQEQITAVSGEASSLPQESIQQDRVEEPVQEEPQQLSAGQVKDTQKESKSETGGLKKEFPTIMLRSELGIFGLTEENITDYYDGTIGPLFAANIAYNFLTIPNFGAIGLLAGAQSMLLILSPQNTDYGDWDEQKVFVVTKLGAQAVSSSKSKLTVSAGLGYAAVSVTTVITDDRGNTYDPTSKSESGMFADFMFSLRPLNDINLTLDVGYGTLVAGEDNIYGGNKIVIGGSLNF